MSPRRGDRAAPPPTPSEYDLRFASTPWHILMFDRSDPDDRRWLIATVEAARPADAGEVIHLGNGEWAAVAAWVRSVTGRYR